MIRSKMKKAAGLIFTAALAVSFLSTRAMAGPVEKSEELIYAAQNCNDGETIRLLADIRLDDTLVFDCGGKTVTLDLAGCLLEIIDPEKNGIAITGENGMLVIKDTQGAGKLYAECGFTGEATENDTAGIRVLDTKQTLVIDGGEVYAKGGSLGAGIGGSLEGTGAIIVKSGYVTAEGGAYGAGIGGGANHFAGDIVIEGGDVKGIGGEFAAGIGTGGFEAVAAPAVKGNKVTVYNGNVTAIGGVNAAGIGGGQYQGAVALTVLDGKIDAEGGDSGAGIGAGNLNFNAEEAARELYHGDIVVSGGNVKAIGGKAAAGIGTGEGNNELLTELKSGERSILIDGGNVIAVGGDSGAGIGGGAFVSGGKVTIRQALGKTVRVEATGGKDGAGIGGGKGGVAGVLLAVEGGSVAAVGGENAAGIGTGAFTREYIQPTAPFFSERKNVVITGGQISVYGGNDGAAIGGGTGGAGVDLKIYGSPVIEAVSIYKTTIGAGKFSYDHGSSVIDGGNIRVNKSMGAQPQNSQNRNVYLGKLTVVTEDNKSPVVGAVIETISDTYSYGAVTDAYGAAAMYLPPDIIGLSIKPADGSLRNRVTGKITVTEDHKGAATLTVTNDEPVKILSREHTYYPGDSNTYQLECSGGINETTAFSIINNECGIDIDKKTGLLTIPVQIEPGEHNFTVIAWKGSEVTDSAPFTLRVTDALSAISPSRREIITEVNRENLIRIDAQPLTSEIAYCNWQVVYGSEEDYQLVTLPDEGSKKAASFNSRKPGVYTVMAAAQDARGNKAWETVHITVVDSAVSVFANQSITGEDGEAREGSVRAWSIDRTSPETAELVFAYEGEGPYQYLLKESLGYEPVPEEGFTEGGFLRAGRNAITIRDLEAEKSYDYHIRALNGSGEENVIGTFAVPSFWAPDILPPAVTDTQIERDDGQSATVYFTADEPGIYSYAFEGEAPSQPDNLAYDPVPAPAPLLRGKNKFTVEDLQDREQYALKLMATDQNGNQSDPVLLNIPEYVRQDGMRPVLTGGFAVREAAGTARIGFNTTIEGECYYSYSKRHTEMPRLVMTEPQAYAYTDDNEILISDLPDGEAYDVYISVKDMNTGKISDVLKVAVEAYDLAP